MAPSIRSPTTASLFPAQGTAYSKRKSCRLTPFLVPAGVALNQSPRLVPQPGQNTSSHGVPAISAARIVGDHSMSRLAASCSFQWSTTA